MVSPIFKRRAPDAKGLSLRRILLASLIITATLRTAAVAQQPGNDPFLPPGEGRDRVVQVCTSCHAARIFGQLREGAPGWRIHVNDMLLHGVLVQPADVDAIVNYLSTKLGPGVPLPGAAQLAVSLPDGQGRELVEGMCQACHGLDQVATKRRSAREWDLIVTRMVRYGAPVTKEETKDITRYLSLHLGS
jgi:mono/diheme cytochrome c family protein